jgi:hypothetical protein
MVGQNETLTTPATTAASTASSSARLIFDADRGDGVEVAPSIVVAGLVFDGTKRYVETVGLIGV